MFTIGDFARHGRVSMRMLRHYDALGLLRPAHVDPATGYRYYDAGQLQDLNQIVALKDLGFTLDQVGTLRAAELTTEQLRGLLTMRRAELEAELAERTFRHQQVEWRLRALELAEQSPYAVVVKTLPATRVVELTATAASFTPEEIGPVVRPLCAELGDRLSATTIRPTGRLICSYERTPGDEDEVLIHAAVPAAVSPGDDLNGLTVVDHPATAAATTIHRGPMGAVLPAWQALARWVDEAGRRTNGPSRELYLDCPEDENRWTTELQEPIA